MGLRKLLDTAIGILRSSRRGAGELAAARRERLGRLIAFVRKKSPYYRALYASLPADVADLESLPPVTKTGLMENFDGWVTDAAVTRRDAEAFVADTARIGHLFLERYLAFTTSGTTGSPAIFLQDEDAMTVYAALAGTRHFPSLLAPRTLGPLLLQGARVAAVVAAGGHYASSSIEKLVLRRFRRLGGRSRSFSVLSPLPELVRSLNEYRPAILGGYPTVIDVLAREQAEGRLAIAPVIVFTGAERLSASSRRRIAASFGCPVRDAYAASEFMGIAYDCRLGRLHLNADWAVLEPVDAAWQPVPPGRPSHTCLLTNLANRVQPILRYDLGDSVTLMPESCACGSALPVIRVEGRRDEVLHFRGDGGGVVPLLPMAIGTVVEETPGVRGYQAIRKGPALLRLRIDEVPGSDRSKVLEAVTVRMRGFLDAQGLRRLAIHVAEERPRRGAAGGKMVQVFSEP